MPSPCFAELLKASFPLNQEMSLFIKSQVTIAGILTTLDPTMSQDKLMMKKAKHLVMTEFPKRLLLLPAVNYRGYRHRYVTVYYRWHPLCGHRLRVHRQEARERRGETLFCELLDETVIAVPAWMTHSDAANLALGPPQPSTDALLELRALLDALQNPV